MWQVTYNTLPSQEELMQFVMMGGMSVAAQTGGIAGQMDPMMQQQWMSMEMGQDMGSSDWGYPTAHGSEANLLTGAPDDVTGTAAVTLVGGTTETPNSAPSGGKMQKVGDKWMFVQGSGS
jgi:protein NRD1